MNNGLSIPSIGYGTWLIDKADAKRCVMDAIEVGYRHIDTAQGYGNEKEVAEGIRESGIDRSEIFVTSKVMAELKDYESAKKSIQESLDKMGFDYIDLMLIHCPQPWAEYNQNPYRYYKENAEVWRAMEEFYEQGKLKSIGISNFNIEDMKYLLSHSKIKPMVNQIPFHIGCSTDLKIVDFCQGNDILVEAYCPNGHGRLIDNPDIKRIADKYNVSVASLCIRFTLECNTVSLPKTMNKAHMIENLDIDFKISDSDMAYLKTLKNL